MSLPDKEFDSADDAYDHLMEKLKPEDRMIVLLTDIWHNQATIIKWLSKIAENTKK